MDKHKVIKVAKERTGFGKWGVVYTRTCQTTGKVIRQIKNWHGARPVGAFACPHCGSFITI